MFFKDENLIQQIGLILLGSGFGLVFIVIIVGLIFIGRQKKWFVKHGTQTEAEARVIEVKKVRHGMASKDRIGDRDWFSWDMIEAVTYTAEGRPMTTTYTRSGSAEEPIGATRRFTLFYDPQEPEYTSTSHPKANMSKSFTIIGGIALATPFLGLLVLVLGSSPLLGAFVIAICIVFFIRSKVRLS